MKIRPVGRELFHADRRTDCNRQFGFEPRTCRLGNLVIFGLQIGVDGYTVWL